MALGMALASQLVLWGACEACVPALSRTDVTLFPSQMTYPQQKCPFFQAEVSNTPFPRSASKEEAAGALQRRNKELWTEGKANLPLSKRLWDCGLLLTPVPLRSQVELSVHVFLLSTSSNTSKMTWEVRRDVVVLCHGRLLECSVLTENAH